MLKTQDVADVIVQQFGVDHDLIQIMDRDGIEVILTSRGNPGGKMVEDFYRTEHQDSSNLPHRQGVLPVEIGGTAFVAVIRKISRNNGIRYTVEHRLLALYINPNSFAHADEEDEVFESLTNALDDVICSGE